jgi:AraC-like DNA-binding protein
MPGKATFSLKVLRDAIRRRVDETSIRLVAKELGMSPSGLHVLLGGSKPHPGTRAKLVSWYVEQRRAEQGVGQVVSADDVDAALRLLVHYITQDGREDAQQRRAQEIAKRLEDESGIHLR